MIATETVRIDPINPPRPRRRPPAKTDPNPRVLRVTVDGARALAVSTAGRGTQKRAFLVDPDVWEWVVATFGAGWRLNSNGKGRHYVSTQRRAAGRHAGQRAPSPKASLSRIIMGQGDAMAPRRAVAYRNGNPCDLRIVNLEDIPRGACSAYRPKSPPAVVVDGWHDA